MINAKAEPECSEFYNLLLSNFLLPTITVPTKINKIKDTLIDNILINEFNPDCRSGNLTVGISDHLPSFLIIPKNCNINNAKINNLRKRDLRRFRPDSFKAEFNSIDWENVINITQNDTNKSFNSFFAKMNELLDKHIPYRKLTKKEIKTTLLLAKASILVLWTLCKHVSDR